MIVDGKRVNIEIQIEDEGNYPERSMFHWAKMFASSLPSGNNYSLLPKTIVISILGFKQFDCTEVHSEFAPMEINRHEILSDKQCYHFFELPKLPDVDSINATEEFKYLEILRARTKHDEAQAIHNAEKRRDEHWQSVVADKNSIIADKDALIAELQANLGIRT